MTMTRTPTASRGGSRIGRIILSALALALPGRVSACDVCAVYSATEMADRRPGLRAGVATQVTDFDTLQESGVEVSNPAHQHLLSAITQVVVGYNPGARFGLQLNLPIISRTFRRLEQGQARTGDETSRSM